MSLESNVALDQDLVLALSHLSEPANVLDDPNDFGNGWKPWP